MRAVIRVIDTAAVITGAVTQNNCKEKGSHVPLDTQTHRQALCLKAERVQTPHGQSGCWQEMRWGNQKTNSAPN